MPGDAVSGFSNVKLCGLSIKKAGVDGIDGIAGIAGIAGPVGSGRVRSAPITAIRRLPSTSATSVTSWVVNVRIQVSKPSPIRQNTMSYERRTDERDFPASPERPNARRNNNFSSSASRADTG